MLRIVEDETKAELGESGNISGLEDRDTQFEWTGLWHGTLLEECHDITKVTRHIVGVVELIAIGISLDHIPFRIQELDDHLSVAIIIHCERTRSTQRSGMQFILHWCAMDDILIERLTIARSIISGVIVIVRRRGEIQGEHQLLVRAKHK